jgi:hypothetical protein
MLIAVGAIVPSILVVIPMVSAIVVALAWPNHAAHDKSNQSQQKGAGRNMFCVYHETSFAIDSTADQNSS